MKSNNPVFSRNDAFNRRGYATFDTPPASQLEDMYAAPSATPVRAGQMTVDDVVTKLGISFAVLLVGAAVGWMMPQLAIIGAIVGLVLGLVNSFKREPSPALILAYAGFQGIFVGGISRIFETQWEGIVGQAVLGTLSVFFVALFLYRSKRIQVTPKFQRMAFIAIGGYLIFVIANLIAGLFGVGGGWGFRTGPLGILVGLFAVGLAAVFLILDFDFIEQGVRNGLPEKMSWYAAFGLLVTLVWLYVEMLRLIAILRGDQ
jgi:uncharacterized YccA/Bax inhibitor family protein